MNDEPTDESGHSRRTAVKSTGAMALPFGASLEALRGSAEGSDNTTLYTSVGMRFSVNSAPSINVCNLPTDAIDIEERNLFLFAADQSRRDRFRSSDLVVRNVVENGVRESAGRTKALKPTELPTLPVRINDQLDSFKAINMQDSVRSPTILVREAQSGAVFVQITGQANGSSIRSEVSSQEQLSRTLDPVTVTVANGPAGGPTELEAVPEVVVKNYGELTVVDSTDAVRSE